MKCGVWLIAAALAVAPAAASSAVVHYVAPAGALPAGHLRNAVFDAVLPSGRIVTPWGQNAICGMNALGVALSPDGRFAIVSNADARAPGIASALDPQITGGYSLGVVDTATMRVVDRFTAPGQAYFGGVSAIADPASPDRTLVFASGGPSGAVDVFDLDPSGHLTADLRPVIPIPAGSDPAGGRAARSFPVALVPAQDGRRLYVVDSGSGSVTPIDTFTRTIAGPSRAVGFSPFGAAVAGNTLLVTNEGLMRYAPVAAAASIPPFMTPPPDPQRASSLSLLELAPDGSFAVANGDGAPGPSAVPMDVAPDGLNIVGGAHPTAIAVTPDAAYAFVAMTNVDRIATVRLGAGAHVAGGTELRLFDRGPYGTQPAALALSSDGTRLYAALAGLNVIAVLDARDPLHLHRLGLIPTGWLPSALALSRDDRTLFVVNTKGFGHDSGFTGASVPRPDSGAIWSTLQKIDLASVRLTGTTFTALKNTREARSTAPTYPAGLRNVVVILEENKSFDAMLGDLGYGPADPHLVRFGAGVTPNLHALARRYALAGNLFADADESNDAHQYIAGGTATPYAQRVAPADPSADDTTANPEDYPRAGYIYHDLARHAVSFRDYGDWLGVQGYDNGGAADPKVDDPTFAGVDDRRAPTEGLGGRFASNSPASAVLAGHVDLNYPGWNLRIRDERRAHEFIRDYSALVSAHRQPRYTQIWLPADHTGTGPDLPPAPEEVADGDRALGTIVQYFSRLKSWKQTVIFVLPDDARDGHDHIDDDRTYAVVISPFAKRGFVGMRHLSPASVLKTSEEILHVPPLSLGDLLATDMSDFFTPRLDARPFASIAVPVQTAGSGPVEPSSSAAGQR